MSARRGSLRFDAGAVRHGNTGLAAFVAYRAAQAVSAVVSQTIQSAAGDAVRFGCRFCRCGLGCRFCRR